MKPTKKHIGLRVRLEYDNSPRERLAADVEIVGIGACGLRSAVRFVSDHSSGPLASNSLLWLDLCRILEVLPS